MASRYSHDETYVLQAAGQKKKYVADNTTSSTGAKWKKLVAVAGAVVSASAVGAAYLTRDGVRAEATLTLEAQHANHAQLRGSASFVASSVEQRHQFDLLDKRGTGSITTREITAYLTTPFMVKEDEIQKDATLSEDVKVTKIRFVRSSCFQKTMCWNMVFHKMLENQSPQELTKETFPAFLAQVNEACPDGAFESKADPLALVDVPLPTKETKSKVQELATNPSLFVQMDKNQDELLDAEEITKFFQSRFDALIHKINDDALVPEEAKKIQLQVLQTEIAEQLHCLRFAIDKMAKDRVLITPATYSLFETLMGVGCETGKSDQEIKTITRPDMGETKEQEQQQQQHTAPDVDTDRTAATEPKPVAVDPLALLDPVPSIPESTEISLGNEEEEISPFFLQVDKNHDLVLDEDELTSFLKGYFESLVRQVKNNEEMPDAVKQYAINAFQHQRAKQLHCLSSAIHQMEREKLLITPATYPQLEKLSIDACVVGDGDQNTAPVEPEIVTAPSEGVDERVQQLGKEEPVVEEQPLVGQPPFLGELGPQILTEHPMADPDLGGYIHSELEYTAPTSTEIAPTEEAVNDVEPGQQPPSTDADVPSGPEQLKEMLMKAFKLTPPEDGNVDDTSSPVVDQAKQDEAEAKKELKNALIDMMLPKGAEVEDQPSASTLSPIEPAVAILEDNGSWNWLHPSVATYSQVKDPHRGEVSVPTVYQHLLDERESRTQALISKLLRTELDYKHTLTCFSKGTDKLKKSVISHEEYDHIIQWMNEKCINADDLEDEKEDVKEQEDHDQDHKFMTKAEFKALISKHFQPVIDDFNAGRISLQKAVGHANDLQAKISSCIDRATEHAAVDQVNGKVHESNLPASLDWIVNSCADGEP